jgi:Ni,Fe-hydrogenase I cytochrome b subunit
MKTKVLYNVTISVDHEISADWLHWMKAVHIPDVMATGMFIEYRMLKMLSGENSGITYAVQYVCESHEKLNEYQTAHAPALQREHLARYGDKATAFRTILEILE